MWKLNFSPPKLRRFMEKRIPSLTFFGFFFIGRKSMPTFFRFSLMERKSALTFFGFFFIGRKSMLTFFRFSLT